MEKNIDQIIKQEMNIYLISAGLVLLIVLYLLRKKRAKGKVIRVITDKCTGCQRCSKKCRRQVFELADNEFQKYIVVKYPEKCTACKDCIIVCKFKALELVDRR